VNHVSLPAHIGFNLEDVPIVLRIEMAHDFGHGQVTIEKVEDSGG
jgi:hypothetical protein